MTDTEKQNLIKSLATNQNFNPQLSIINQKWVVGKVISYLENLGRTDSQIKTEAKQIVVNFKTIVNKKKNFKISLKFKSSLVKQNLKRRVEIIYGVLAENPQLREAANNNYLDFIIKRRYRSVVRMDYFVNPNKQGYFRYPNTCKLPLSYPFTVNKSASSHWENLDGEVIENAGTPNEKRTIVPLNILKKDPADSTKTVNPVQAINLLFTKKDKPCEGNLQECGRVLTITHLDALQEAKNPETLMRHQVGLGADRSFFSIYPITFFPGIIEYNGADALFEYKGVKVEDFKVGDHLYIFNHPLYKVFKPTGDWRGEHCYVYRLGNRNIRSQKGYRFGGHGKEGTLFQLYNAFMQNLKTFFTRAYKIGKIHLDYMQFGSSSLPPGCTVTDKAHTLNLGGNSFSCHLYQYNLTFSYKNHRKNRKRNYLNETNFLIIQFLTENIFVINGEKDLNTIVATNRVINPIKFVRTSTVPPGGNKYDHPEWKIHYTDANNADQFQPIFLRVRGKITIKLIKRKELFEAPFKCLDALGKTVITSQPKIDLSTAYKAFLVNKGAIN